MSSCGYIHVNAGDHKDQKGEKTLNRLELDGEGLSVAQPAWVLGAKLRSCGRAVCLLGHALQPQHVYS